MTAVLLTYRPPSVALLRGAVGYMQAEEAKRRFARNTTSLILHALAPKFERETYLAFVQRIENREPPDTRTYEQIRDDLIAKLRGDK